jgi:hypothetical protein
MIKKSFFSVVVAFALVQVSFAQSKHRVAIFAPLYLDSAFDEAGNYRYGKQFPKFFNAGLEFYEGAQMALDSLGKQGAGIEAFVYDTRSTGQSLAKQLEKIASDSVELIIGFANPQENWSIASAARSRQTPYINVNLPNDAGVTNNPYFVMLNSTLKTHIEKIYKYIQKNYPLDNVVVFRKKGQMEDAIKTYFGDNGKTAPSVVNVKYVDLTDSFTVSQLSSELDSNHHTVVLAGSLDENFGKRLCVQLASIARRFPVTLIGMPTFDNFTKEFSRPEYKGLEIIYTTPFYNSRTDHVSESISNRFNIAMYARPSDMVMRGYEVTWRFSKLLLQYQKDISSNLTRKEFNVFREFDIQPVINKQTNVLDYFENKKLFFVKYFDGIIKAVN